MHPDIYSRPDWGRLYAIASEQDGYFTTAQAAAAGYSPQLLQKHLRGKKLQRIRRGIYRLEHFPAREHEDLAIVWLWSERQGVFSHQTAMFLHELSDLLPVQAHLTVPAAWHRRRLRVPEGVALHHADVEASDRALFGSVPVTSVRRTLTDCARDELAPDLLRQAAMQALQRGLVSRSELAEVEDALRPFGGLEFPTATACAPTAARTPR